MTNKSHTVLYTGVTNDLVRRVAEHKVGVGSTFTNQYKCTQLLYFESATSMSEAITREKQIKNRPRQWKESLIAEKNPRWSDLSYSIGISAALLAAVRHWYEAQGG